MTLRADTPNGPLRWLIGVYGVVVGLGMYLMYWLVRPLLALRVSGDPAAAGPCIYASWHENVSVLLQSQVWPVPGGRLARPQVWLQHPVWYMRAVHVLIRLVGVDAYVLGSSGHGGRAAADELLQRLRGGASTVIFPDGPAGPPRTLHKGVLHLARDSGLPIVPIQVTTRRCPRASGWDRKYWPVWSSELNLHFGAPITVDDETVHSAAATLTQAL
ncbi:MAG: DUF374 domain-containing protein [Pseudomonadota bacterium]